MIYQIKAYLLKHKLIISFIPLVILILLIFYFASNVPNQPIFTPTVPLIPPQNSTPIQSPENFSMSFPENKNIQISDSYRVFSVDKTKRLVYVAGDTTFPLSPSDVEVIDYNTRGDSILYETGTLSDPENVFFLYNFKNNVNLKLKFNELRPVIAYYLSPDENNIGVIGHYDPHTYTGDLYIYNIETGNSNKIAENIPAGKVEWIDNINMLLTKEIDKMPPNFFFSIFSLKTNSTIVKDVPVTKRSLFVDTQNNQILFINSITNNLSSLSLQDYKFRNILTLKPSNTEIIYNNKTSSIILLNLDQPTLIGIRSIDKNTGKTLKDSAIELGNDDVYIEKLNSNGNYFYKTYNRKTKTYSVQSLPL